MKRLSCTVIAFCYVWVLIVGAWWCSGEPFEQSDALAFVWFMGCMFSTVAGIGTWSYPGWTDGSTEAKP